MIPKKLPKIPKVAFCTPCHIIINQEGITEDGEPIEEIAIDTKCIYSEKAHNIMDAEKRIIRLEGYIIVDGDIAPSLPVIADGTVDINARVYKIYRSERPRNPDGSIHHTKLELM